MLQCRELEGLCVRYTHSLIIRILILQPVLCLTRPSSACRLSKCDFELSYGFKSYVSSVVGQCGGSACSLRRRLWTCTHYHFRGLLFPVFGHCCSTLHYEEVESNCFSHRGLSDGSVMGGYDVQTEALHAEQLLDSRCWTFDRSATWYGLQEDTLCAT